MHRELELFVMAGLSPVDAIKGCTYNAAKILQDEYGSIQEGLSADVLIVDGNPAENISDSRNVRYVFMQRKQIDLQSLTRQ
jgi:imidazolonepropionase-like amidohydrolase